MGELELSLNDFREYSTAKRLRELHLPNGPTQINLRQLYDGITSWKINDRTLAVDDIAAIIVFGSAVRYPGFVEEPTITKKY